MKKAKSLFLFAIIAAMFSSLLVGHSFKGNAPVEISADSTQTYPRNGESGTIMYVNGSGTYFKKGEADLAIYCFNSDTDYAWSDRVDYRVFGDIIRVMIPYKNGQSKKWSKFIICRYNPELTPEYNKWDGVYNQSNDVEFSSFLYAQNTITVNGYTPEDRLSLQEMKTYYDYFGVKAENHMYLDLSNFTDWEQGNAKFALFFGAPEKTNESRWSQVYGFDGAYHSSFCWKVEGQDNPHLYECIVPNIYGQNSYNLWNLVIAVRFNPEAQEPEWNDSIIWNKTGNLSYNTYISNANIVKITDWNVGELDKDNIIANTSRLDFFGNYFLNTVSCSGTGLSDATTNEQWNAVKNAYGHLSRNNQGTVWTTQADEEGSDLAKAMARYDYIVLFKQYNHEDFINRAESPNKTVFPTELMGFVANSKTPNTTIYIILVVALLIPTITIPVIIILKKRFH